MDRPKREDYEFIEEVETIFGPLGTIERFDYVSYQQALNNYVDQLEKALDKACEMLEDFDLATHHVDDELFNKEEWKEWCMEDE